MKLRTENLNLFYGDFQALKNINLGIRANAITAIIGPSGCGKSTLLRTFNRMNELIDGVRISGKVFFDDRDIFTAGIEPTELRKKIGMVFQRPNAFPLSVYANITYGPRVHRSKSRTDLGPVVERTLDAVHLWDELKDRLRRSALELTLEQQQRLCIARLLAVEPEVLLMDEPCSALDPIATLRIEELMYELKKTYTIAIVTHNMQQAARVSDETGFMLLGDLVEFGVTEQIFTKPRDPRTESYIAGKFG